VTPGGCAGISNDHLPLSLRRPRQYLLQAFQARTTLSRSKLKSLPAGEFEIGAQTVCHHALGGLSAEEEES
jgi:hypothetical protein